jgi:peptide/nickel transport system substrate-binding protein
VKPFSSPQRPTLQSKSRTIAGMAGALLLVAGLTACGGSGPAKEDNLIIGRVMDTTTLDPSRSLCDTCQIYLSAVYETMVKANSADGPLEPLLAETWTANADNTEFTFKLRPDAVFADGSPVEAKDVKWSWERMQNIKGSPSYFMDGIAGVEAPDPQTVVVTATKPTSAFVNVTSASYMGIINSDIAIENGATADANAATTDKAEQWFLTNSAGSGQYELESYSEGSELALKRNDNYWGDKGSFSGVTIKEVSDSSAQLQQLQQGDIDVAMQLSFDAIDQIESDPNIVSEVVPTYNYVYVALSPGVAGGEALLDPRVRQAIRMGIDYDAAINASVAGNGDRQSTAIPNGFEGSADLPLPEYDPEGAKKLLAEAGHPDGLTFDAVYPNFTTYGVSFSTMFQSVQQSLQTIGVDLTLTPMEYNAWTDRINDTGIPLTALFFAPDHPDTIQYEQYFGLIEGSTWLERSRLPINPVEVQLVDKALSESGAERTKTYTEIGQAMWDDAIILPVVNPQMILGNSADIEGNNYHITRNLDLSVMRFKQ